MDTLRQFVADAVYTVQILHAGTRHTLQAAKLLEKNMPALGSETGDFLKWRLVAGLPPPLPVAGDGKTVSLIADLLYQVQGR